MRDIFTRLPVIKIEVSIFKMPKAFLGNILQETNLRLKTKTNPYPPK